MRSGGLPATEGVYLRYPHDELLAVTRAWGGGGKFEGRFFSIFFRAAPWFGGGSRVGPDDQGTPRAVPGCAATGLLFPESKSCQWHLPAAPGEASGCPVGRDRNRSPSHQQPMTLGQLRRGEVWRPGADIDDPPADLRPSSPRKQDGRGHSPALFLRIRSRGRACVGLCWPHPAGLKGHSLLP